MKIVSEYPLNVEEIENVWIPMSDGIRLAARLWLPEGASHRPVPAILEYIPYRKRDFYREIDESIHPYFAGHGYACVRVDMRGSGDSEGVLSDEYLKQEQEDGLAILRWIAAQPWCTGDVGMMGISWGGFNSLQIAALRPPELKAIITVASTDDRYADDVHYMGGCLLLDNLAWAAQMFVRNARPPDPEIVGERWRDMWLGRLEAMEPFIRPWLTHQRRDEYWKHGSVCEDYEAITCAVFAIGGWADGYSNSVSRLLAGLRCPRRGLIGPWPHDYPHRATPGPRIGFLQEALRWWDQWLKGIQTGVMDEPMYRVWMQESVPPMNFYSERPGRWVAEPEWPSPRIEPRRYWLTPGHLGEQPAADEAMLLRSPQTTGIGYQKWCPYGMGPEMASDQRGDDAFSLIFDSDPLSQRIEILGAPILTVEVSSDQPQALLAVRLNDVAPDGAAALVTYGVLNLTHREDHGQPKPLEPGRRYSVAVKLNDIAHAFPAGHRLRVAIANAYWPLVWPSPQATSLIISTKGSHLELPFRLPRPEDEQLRDLAVAEVPVGLRRTVIRPADYDRRICHDQRTGKTTISAVKDLGHWRIDAIDLTGDAITEESYCIRPDDPLSARAEITSRHQLKRNNWQVAAVTRSVMTASADQFIVDLDLDAYEGDRRLSHRTWHFEIARDHV